MRQRVTVPSCPGQPWPAGGASGSSDDQALHLGEPAAVTEHNRKGNGPILVLSYAHSGAQEVQNVLS
jgi:hypothetical protein